MNAYSDYPAVHFVFDAYGGIGKGQEVPEAPTSADGLLETLRSQRFLNVTDLMIMSHGWNNDASQATDLYERFFAEVAKIDHRKNTPFRGRIGVLGIMWPSKRFDIPKSFEGAVDVQDHVRGQLKEQLDVLISGAATPVQKRLLNQARSDIDALADHATQARFLRALLESIVFDEKSATEGDDGANLAAVEFVSADDIDAVSALQRLTFAPELVPDIDAFDPIGGAMGFLDVKVDGGFGTALSRGTAVGSLLAAALNLANFTTYAIMKERAGIIGRLGLAPILSLICTEVPALRTHLVGHSFGSRLVTAAVAHASRGYGVDSLILLQAAFSHNGMANAWDGKIGHDGLYRSIISNKRIRGSTIITHSRHDIPNALAYPLASRMLGQQASAYGGPSDPFGAMGANGAQHADASFETLLPLNQKYARSPAKIRNLSGDGPDVIIRDHADVAKEEIAYAILSML